jgi:hypothetical protein
MVWKTILGSHYQISPTRREPSRALRPGDGPLKGGGTMASVTEEINKERRQTNQNNDGPDQTEPSIDEPDQLGLNEALSQREMTQEDSKEWDSGTAPMSHEDQATLTGKLCKRVMALIRWQCGTDTAVDDRMVRALEGWLRKRGISIYTDLFPPG